jgi:sigma-B regulation protein RsbU (phosphoserine phosphatase)
MTDGEPVVLLEFRIQARSDELGRMRAAVRRCVSGSGCGEEATADVVLAIDEACQNIIRHAYKDGVAGPIELTIRRSGSDLIFDLVDHAPRIDPANVKPRDLADIRPGGLGTHFIRDVMDRVDFLPRPGGDGNLLKMVRRIQ